jgi:hypothetical protein
MGIAVSSGAVLRSLNKQYGPIRDVRASVGILRKVPYEPNHIPEQVDLPESYIEYDSIDGIDYVPNSIDWVIKKASSQSSTDAVMV